MRKKRPRTSKIEADREVLVMPDPFSLVFSLFVRYSPLAHIAALVKLNVELI